MPPTSALPRDWVCPKCRQLTHGFDAPGLPVPRCAACVHAMVPADALAAGDGDPFLGRIVANRFVVIRRLGAGSMGTVYRARQETVARDIALKILRSDRALDELSRQRFVREAKAMSLLVSPHTVTVFDFGEMIEPGADPDLGDAGVSLFLAMELLDGESLGDRLKRGGRMLWSDALPIAREALLSLSEAHDKGVIHRDLKPDNLFLSKAVGGGETVKVLDFGIAKVLTDKSPMVDALETQAGTVFGTPRYMSPEQAQGRQLDARSDLYSLGVILYQMIVGRAPFVDDDAVVVMARHIKQKPVPPQEAAKDAAIPSGVSRLVMRVLSKSPADRPQDAEAFIREIDEVMRSPSGADTSATDAVTAVTLAGGGDGEAGAGAGPASEGAARRATPAPPPPRSSRAWTVAAAIGGAVLVAVGAAFLARMGGSGPAARPALGAAARARADVLLMSLSVRAASATAAPSAPPAAGAPSPSSAPAAASAAASGAPSAKASGAPTSRPAATKARPYQKLE